MKTSLPFLCAAVCGVMMPQTLSASTTVLEFSSATFSEADVLIVGDVAANSGKEFRWIGVDDSNLYDLRATLTGGSYNGDPSKTGITSYVNPVDGSIDDQQNGDFGSMHFNGNAYAEFKFQLVNTGTNNTASVSSWQFAVFDFDTGAAVENQPNNAIESMTLLDETGVLGYVLSGSSEIDVSRNGDNDLVFSGTTQGFGDDNPATVDNLTPRYNLQDEGTRVAKKQGGTDDYATDLAANRSVLFNISGTSEINVAFGVSDPGSPRNFLIGGTADFTGFSPQSLQVPEPSTSLLLGMSGLSCLLRRRR